MGRLDTKERKELPNSDFAGKGRSFPIPDKSHAVQALRMKGHASPAEQKQIVRKVHDKYPDVGSGSEQATEGVQRETDMGSMLKSALGKKKK